MTDTDNLGQSEQDVEVAIDDKTCDHTMCHLSL